MSHANRRTARLSRRAALRAGAGVGAVGAGLAVGATDAVLGPAVAAAQPASAWRMEHLEVDFLPVDPVSIVRAGSGPPQRGDWFHISAAIYAKDAIGGARLGTYQCFGAWTQPAPETGAPDQRLTTVQFQFDGGAIMGLINEGGADPSGHVGAVQGGTGRFAGALGTFRQITLTGVISGVTPGQAVVRGILDLLLPNLGGQAAPQTAPRPAPAQVPTRGDVDGADDA